jgi:hypothetical protein
MEGLPGLQRKEALAICDNVQEEYFSSSSKCLSIKASFGSLP